jgi:DNA-binding winged helix-turn-helix (wHTH) protein
VQLAFDDFVFDALAFQLRKAGKPVRVDAKALELLAYLLERPGELVTKDELLERVWEGRALSDNVVSVTMAKLRRALDGSQKPDGDGFIVNVYGKGYRLDVAAVSRLEPVARLSVPPASSGPAWLPDVSFVGRGAPLTRVVEALSRARAGRGQVVAIVGEPGIGKTLLAEVLTRRASEVGLSSAWAHGREFEIEPPFGPWGRLLRNSGRLASSAAARAALDRATSILLPRVGAPPGWEPTADDGGALDATLDALEALTSERPWVLVFDDLQWADAASLRLLSGIAQEVTHLPLLLLLTVRSSDPLSSDPRAEHLARVLGSRNTELVALERLTEADVNAYAEARLGTPDVAVARAVFTKSEGNPFFMVELLRPFRPSARPRAEDIELPGSALDVVRRQVRRLPDDAKECLSVAAVIGREFDAGLLGSVTGWDARAVLDALEGARATQAIVELPDRPAHFVFGHDLIRGVFIEGLSPSRRSSIHLRVAQALERRNPPGDGVPGTELVHHLLSAVPLGDVRVAVEYALRAADAAANVSAHADASLLLRRALGVLDLSSDPHPHLRSRLLFGLAHRARASGIGEFMGPFREAVSLALANGVGDVLVHAARYMSPMPGVIPLPGAREVLEAADRVLAEDEKELRSEVLARMAWTPPYSLDAARATSLAGRADALAREAESAPSLAIALAAQLYLATGPDSTDLGEALFDCVDRLAGLPAPHRALWAAHASVVRSIVCQQRGDLAGAERAIASFGAVARELANVELEWHADRARAVHRMNTAGFVGMHEVLMDLRQRVSGLGLLGAEAICAVDFGVLVRETLGSEVLASFEGEVVVEETDPPAIRARRIRALAEMGAAGRARAALRQMDASGLDRLPHDRDYLATLVHLATASVATGCLEEGARIYELLMPYPLLYATDISSHADGSVSRYLGFLAVALDRLPQATAHFEVALAQNEKAGFAVQAAHSGHDLARALARSGRQGDARALLGGTIDASRRLGMETLAQKVEALERELSAS